MLRKNHKSPQNVQNTSFKSPFAYQVGMRAIEAPLREIVYKAVGEACVVVNAVLNDKGNYGFNPANCTYSDMIEMGILNPDPSCN